MTNGGSAPGPVVPPPRDGHRRKFIVTDKRRILAEADQPGVSTSEVARRYGIALRVLFRWKQELTPPTETGFVSVEIMATNTSSDRTAGHQEQVP